MADTDHLSAVRDMWRREVEAAGTYRVLAQRETDSHRRDILIRLAECEDRHAAKWSGRIQLMTGHAPDPTTVRSSLRWIERFAEAYAQKPEPEGRAVVVELDEMWHFLKRRPTSSGSGRLGIALRAEWLTGSWAVATPPP